MNTTTNKDKKSIGYDFHGTTDTGINLAPNAVIITGAYTSESDEIDEYLASIDRNDVPVHFLPDEVENTARNVGLHKGSIIKELGLKVFHENDPEEAKVIKEIAPDVNIIMVGEEHKLTYIVFTSEGTGIPIAHHLQNEGYDVIVGQAETFKELGIESTPEEDKKLKKNQELYKGILKKYPALKLAKALEKIKDKDSYFIYCDLNSLYVYGERMLKAGFTKGIFPTKEDYEFEKGREEAMKFVEENYPDIKIIPYQKIKTVEEARKIVEESEVPMVIQSEGDFVSTICPVDDVEKNKTEILSALEKHAAEYAKGEIILKEKLVQPIEITPQIVFWDGEPVFTDIDLETKNIGDGENNGNQVGCGSNLIIRTEFDDKINKIAFPPVVYEMAKKHKGIFVWDISIYVTEKGLFFGEFCSNRFGYDAVLTEMCMAGGASAYFDAIQTLENPLKTVFGTAVRVFNLNKQEDTELTIGDEENTWVYEMKEEKGKRVSLGIFWDLAVITACSDSIEDSVEQMYENLKTLSFKEKYTRTKEDFLCDYPTSIINRYESTNHLFFDAPDIQIHSDQTDTYNKKMEIEKKMIKDEHDSLLKQKESEYNSRVKSLQEDIKSAINV